MPLRSRLLCLVAAAATVSAGAVVAPTMAEAATPAKGALISAVQNTFTHRTVVRGWVFDPAHPSASILVSLYSGSRYLGRVRADDPSPATDSRFGISGRHAYSFVLGGGVTLKTVTMKSLGHSVDSMAVRQVTPSRAARIIIVAKRYVGTVRFVDGGSTPRQGFDCSGYTSYVYRVAKAGYLPHNAAAQKSMRGMRSVSAARARPGDLVFYHGGGGIYHVAIYAGHHRQYAAATPRDGVVYQNIWSSAVSYGHLA